MPHSHGHSHGHNHGHSHEQPDYSRTFAIALALNGVFVAVEVISGFLAHSLALLADGGHNLSDVLALLLSWGANALARRRPTHRYTYGLRRSSILAALLNAVLLLLAMGGVAWEALRSLMQPAPVTGNVVIAVALVGVIINTATAVMFSLGSKNDLNIRAAFLHMAADAMVSLGVVVAGIGILITGWLWIDPVLSLIVVVVVVVGTWGLLKDSLKLALDAVPAGIEPLAIRTYLRELPGVAEIHDLHIWGMSTSETALTVHLVMPAGCPGDGFLARINKELHDHFDIEHATLQIETGDPKHPCVLVPDHLV